MVLQVVSSLFLSCTTLGLHSPRKPGGPNSSGIDVSDPEASSSNLGVSFFLWETIVADSRAPSGRRAEHYFALFDLNRWYQV